MTPLTNGEPQIWDFTGTCDDFEILCVFLTGPTRKLGQITVSDKKLKSEQQWSNKLKN